MYLKKVCLLLKVVLLLNRKEVYGSFFKLPFFMNKKFIFNYIVVGCGGTGGNYLKEFCRFISSLDKDSQRNIRVCFVDGDIVEEKNIARQPFLLEDVNQNKAVALSEICGATFNLDNLTAYPHYLTKVEQVKEINRYMNHNMSTADFTVLIGCVDNHQARQVLHEYYNQCSNILYFDSANEFSNGEVVFAAKINQKEVCPPRGYYFPEVLTDTSPNREEISCEELNAVAGQHIVTNIMAANVLLSASACLIKDGTIPRGIVFFDAFSFTMSHRGAEEGGCTIE